MLTPERSKVDVSEVDNALLPPRRPSPTRWLFRLGALAVIIALAATYSVWYPRIEKILPKSSAASGRPPARPTPVSVAVAKSEDLQLYINALGTVTAFNTVTIRSRVEGELKVIHFKEGQFVHQGDLLVELDARPFEALRDQAKGQMERDEAQLDLARVNLERATELRSQNVNSQQEFDEQLALFKQAQSIVNIDKANLENAQLQVDYTRISAPIDGRIGLKLVDLGNLVRANDPSGLTVITQLQPISVVFTIPQDDIHRVLKRLNQQNEMPVSAYNRDFSTKLSDGTLTALDNQVDSTTGTLRLKAMFENKDNLLFPNEFVNIRLQVEKLEKALTIPSLAIQRGPQSRYVYVVKADEKEPTVDVKNVVVGASEGLMTVIQSGLSEGDIVVTEGIDKLQPGAKVTLPKSE